MHEKADIVLIGEAVYTGVSPNETPSPGGLAVLGNKIVAVGDEDEIKGYIGEGTSVYRFDSNSLIMPGICDSHLHLELTIAAESGPQLRYVKSEEECVAIVKAWRDEHPDTPWIVGQGWHHSNWANKKTPDKKLLSETIPDTPVCLLDVDCHSVWLNQKALDAFGIDENTPNEGGIIYRYENGEATGFIEEGPCIDIFNMGCLAIVKDEVLRRNNLVETCKIFNKRGITSVMDALNTPPHWLKTIDQLLEANELSLRLALTAFLNEGDDFIECGKRLQEKYPSRTGLVSFWGIKALLDGVAGTKTAWMTDGYADDPEKKGYPSMDPEVLRSRVLEAESHGYGVHFHACGTRAVEFALDMVEEAKNKGLIKRQRNTITHCDSINNKDFSRFKELGVVASVQPDMLAPTPSYKDNLYPKHLGEELMANSWAYRKIFDNAPVVSMSSDSPVTIANPFYGIYRATQRIHDDGTPVGGIHPEQKVTLSECLWAYTYGGAYQLEREDILGSLEVGKLADITVIDKNIFKADPSEYRSIEALLTIVDGKIVYEK